MSLPIFDRTVTRNFIAELSMAFELDKVKDAMRLLRTDMTRNEDDFNSKTFCLHCLQLTICSVEFALIHKYYYLAYFKLLFALIGIFNGIYLVLTLCHTRMKVAGHIFFAGVDTLMLLLYLFFASLLPFLLKELPTTPVDISILALTVLGLIAQIATVMYGCQSMKTNYRQRKERTGIVDSLV